RTAGAGVSAHSPAAADLARNGRPCDEAGGQPAVLRPGWFVRQDVEALRRRVPRPAQRSRPGDRTVRHPGVVGREAVVKPARLALVIGAALIVLPGLATTTSAVVKPF